MTDKQNGRLYRAVGAPEVPNSIVALPGRKVASVKTSSKPSKLLSNSFVPNRPQTGLSAKLVYALIIFSTAIIAIIESYFLGDLGWFTRIAFAATAIFAALKANPVDESAAWTAAPIAFAIAVLIKVNITGADIGNFLATQLTGLLVGLSEHMWVILGTTAAAWVIGRRHYVSYLRAKRAEVRQNSAN